MMAPISGKITAPFDHPRPFGSKNPTHVHGAVDLAADRIGEPIFAPEPGELRAYLAIRYKDGTYWPEQLEFDGALFPFLNYFYDMFGGILVLQTPNWERTHVIAHCFGNQLFDRGPFATSDVHWIEEKAKTRWPIHAIYSDYLIVDECEIIGAVGDSGTSTAPHVHWEIHNNYNLNAHADRIDPERWVRGMKS